MIFAVVKDPHYRYGFESPVSRKDVYDDTMTLKSKEVRDICKKHLVDALLIPGDILDKKYPSSYSVNGLRLNMTAMSEMFSGVDTVFTIPGNHDLPFNSFEKIDSSVYNIISNVSRMVEDVSYNTVSYKGVSVSGIPFVNDNTFMDKVEELNKTLDPSTTNIVMVHEHFLGVQDDIDDLKYTSFRRYEDLTQFENIDYFVMGHLHRGFPTRHYETKRGKQFYINPWSMYRMARNYYALNGEHTPEVVLVDTDSGVVTHIPLQSAKEFKEVFSEKKIQEELEVNRKMGAFMSEEYDQKILDFDTFVEGKTKDKMVVEIINASLEFADNKDNQ